MRTTSPRPDSVTPTTQSGASPILLYDGVCTFCNGTVQFILRWDRKGTMRFAPLHGGTARGILERHPEARGVDSLILVFGAGSPSESVAIRSDALLRIAAYLGGVWRGFAIGRLIPRFLRDWGYARFARIRYRLFGREESCPLPSPEDRVRFLP